jgi:hypothetical protein
MTIFNEKKIIGLLGLDLKFEVVDEVNKICRVLVRSGIFFS